MLSSSRPYNRSLLQSEDFDINEFIYVTRDIPYGKFSQCLNDHHHEVKLELAQLVNDEFQKFIELYSTIGDSGTSEIHDLEVRIDELVERMKSLEVDVMADSDEAKRVIDEIEGIEKNISNLESQKALFENIVEFEMLCRDREIGLACIAYMKIKSEIAALSDTIPSASYISQNVHNLLEPIISVLETQTTEAMRASDGPETVRLASNYIVLGRYKEFEHLFVNTIVLPFCSKTITTKMLESLCKERSEKPGLARLYSIILDFIRGVKQNWIVSFQEVVIDPHALGLNMVVQPIFNRIITDLPVIFSPGLPEAFQHAYTLSFEYIQSILDIFSDEKDFILNSGCFLTFQKSWQVNIYYQLRFRDLASKLEEALEVQLPLVSLTSDVINIRIQEIRQFVVLKDVISDIWSESVIITPLIGKIFILTLQTFGRFIDWLVSIPTEFDGTELGMSTMLIKIGLLRELKGIVPEMVKRNSSQWIKSPQFIENMTNSFLDTKWKDARVYLEERFISSSLLFFKKFYQAQFSDPASVRSSSTIIDSLNKYLDEFVSVDLLLDRLVPLYTESVTLSLEQSTKILNNIRRLEQVMKGQLSEEDQRKKIIHERLAKYIKDETAALSVLCQSHHVNNEALTNFL